MYIYLGGNTVISSNEILGIFDMDTSTVNKATRDYLSNSEKNKKVIVILIGLMLIRMLDHLQLVLHLRFP